MKKFIGFTGLGAGALLPLLAAAQQTLGGVGVTILGIINTIILILMALAVLYFVIAVIRYIMAKEEKAKGEARNNMIYGIIGLFVIFSVWGLVKILQTTFGVQGGVSPVGGGFYDCTLPVNIAQCIGLNAICTGVPEVFAYCQ